MTAWRVIIDSKALAQLKKIDKPVRIRIVKLIDSLVTDPRAKGKGLTADKVGTWSYRAADYRILAEIVDKTVTVTVTKIGHRSKVYD